MNKNFSIWLIGPSAVGKTTVSKIIFKKIKKNFPNLMLLDGDKLRNLYEHNLGYDKISRSKFTFRYIRLALWLKEHDISTITAVNSPFEKDRVLCRSQIENYYEVYLNCSMDERIKRDKKNLYIPALKGEKKNVVDVDIPFDKPEKCDLSIDTENKEPELIATEIIKNIEILKQKTK